MRSTSRAARKGFTLVELLVVVLILAILMAVALPLYLGAVSSSEVAASRANMQTIANAMQAARLRSADRAYPTVITDLYGDDKDIPAPINGPGARTYLLVPGGQSCDADGPDASAQDAANVPPNGFGVRSSVSKDGCFIPGLSPR